jgi:ATP-dependent helicase/nuclease subunit A
MSIADARQRAEALDVGHSFCVTAPAGSGKTELLIQRYLALLGRVERPEQVLAITFTRKAAAEMRERVMQALQQALAGMPCESEHQQVTRSLAESALVRSDAGNWHITRDLSRLNIKTIDSFCAGLTRQMPILSRFGGQAQAVDDARPLYLEAVGELYDLLDSGRPEANDIAQLLLHFDNNWDRLGELLVSMLAKRDQWHEYMGARRSPEEAEQRLLATVEAVVEESLQEVATALDPWQDEILDLLCYSRNEMGEAVPAEFPRAVAGDTECWRLIGELFLTQAGTFRKTVNVRNGFPAGKGEPEQRKAHFKDLVSRMSQQSELETDLQRLASLPQMSENTASWQLVLHLSHVLPLLAACLLLVFERRGSVDHSQVALSALDALGDEDAPTELALRLDYSIEHILVDEFQDTAINQYRLVERLTRGWWQHNEVNPAAARTVFIVGDGMQSIYGFRNANVGLFLKARQQGFNGVVPKGLSLRCNFRSQAGVVEWVNDTFRHAFPAQDNIRRGRVSFTDAVAVKPALERPAVSMQGFYGEQGPLQEAAWLVEQLQQALAREEYESIAILGRSRNQLAPILELLRAAKIPFAAQEMDALSGSPAIVDLTSLCRALACPADQVSWLSLLRAPWAGLALGDLHRVVLAAGSYGDIGEFLRRGVFPEGISEAAAATLARLSQCFRWAEQKRDRLALRVWVEQLWQHLGGPESLAEARHLADAGRFFALLQTAQEQGVGLDIDWLQERLARLYASGDAPGARLQVMTLHKAKGLEFDWVIIPALARGTRGDSRDILLWDEYNSPGGERGFLLAADDHSDDKAPTLYNFLKRQRREKSRLETTRLLYVGATRAIRELTLTASFRGGEDTEPGQEPDLTAPSEASLLAPIWPVFERSMILHQPTPAEIAPAVRGSLLQRLQHPPGFTLADGEVADGPNRPERALNRLDRHVGTAVHLALELLGKMSELPAQIPETLEQRLEQELKSLGVWGESLELCMARVRSAVERTLGDEQGRWILCSSHPEAASELALTRAIGGEVEDLVIDRTFVDAQSGERWVIDYKNSAPADGVAVTDFAAEEAGRYRPQLSAYRAAVSTLGPQPVRCALYFTSLGLLHPLVDS